MKKPLNVTIDDIVKSLTRHNNDILNSEFIILETNGAQDHLTQKDILPIRFLGYSLIFVYKGEMTIGIDYIPYTIKKNDVMELFSHHLIDSIRISSNLKAYQIILSPDLFQGIIQQTELSASIDLHTGGFRLVKTMESCEMNILMNQFERLRNSMTRRDHHLFRNLVHAELALLMLEFANIKISHSSKIKQSYQHTHKEEIVARFIQLLINNCKEESEVSFYSTKLCITPEYLSKIMKTFSGKSVNVWIQQARISEAKILLRKPDSSVNQVADELGFSDQSAFGKFFKKHTGKSPLEYQKALSQTFKMSDTDIL